MNNKLFIPDTIKAGYQKREETYTGQLAYVIYKDNKGTWRKEKSWTSWTRSELGSDEFENKPMSGFVLNRSVGGSHRSYSWNARREYVRVFDPRGFEFEISVDNMLFILDHSDCVRGKGLTGEFVYSWSGTELVLLPVAAPEYKESKEYNARQDGRVMAKELIVGNQYLTKDDTYVVYMGRIAFAGMWYTAGYYSSDGPSIDKKNHIVYDLKAKKYRALKSVPKVLRKDYGAYPEATSLLDALQHSFHTNPIDRIEIGEFKHLKQLQKKIEKHGKRDYECLRIPEEYQHMYYRFQNRLYALDDSYYWSNELRVNSKGIDIKKLQVVGPLSWSARRLSFNKHGHFVKGPIAMVEAKLILKNGKEANLRDYLEQIPTYDG